ncbi:TPA: ISLre2 family transposase [Escherichia coli]
MLLDIRHIVGIILLFVQDLMKIIRESKDFYELERGIHEVIQKVSKQLLEWVAEEMDRKLMENRDKRAWEIVGFRAKQVISIFGEFTYKRRLYRNKETGETKFLLDEVLGIPRSARITPGIREVATKLATEVPFRRAAEILSYLFPHISTMTIWRIVQEVGEEIKKESEEKKGIVFEYGEMPEGKEETPKLYIEGDGVIIRLQREEKKRGEIKHFVVYEGKEEEARGRYKLKNKLVVSGLAEGESMWEEVYAKVGSKWKLDKVKKVYIGGDGAEWPKEGLEYFSEAEYRLDPYHLQKNLVEALWYDEETYDKVREAIYQGDIEKTRRTLEEAIKKTKGERRKKVVSLLKYLTENWEGIIGSSGAERLGAIEGQIQHNIARRMKRLGARWTKEGGDKMSRILSEKANGRLKDYTKQWHLEQGKIKKILQPVEEEEKRKYAEEDIEGWIKVSLPILEGPYASKPWIKYVLKEITRANGLAVGI